MLKCGDTFLTGDGDEETFHLWIIITPPNQGDASLNFGSVVVGGASSRNRMCGDGA
jgi:hypothetical protein